MASPRGRRLPPLHCRGRGSNRCAAATQGTQDRVLQWSYGRRCREFGRGVRQGMRDLGYVEGKTFVLEARYADGKPEKIPELARELVGLKVDVIVPTTDAPIAALKRETRTIPIVMANSTDPVGTGFVASLAHPGGNVTGLTNLSVDLSGKRLE